MDKNIQETTITFSNKKLYNRANAWFTIHFISRSESFSLKHKYCRKPEYGFVDLNSVIVTP